MVFNGYREPIADKVRTIMESVPETSPVTFQDSLYVDRADEVADNSDIYAPLGSICRRSGAS